MRLRMPNILLIEDDNLDIINVQRILGKINLTHRLFIARNGEEALKCLLMMEIGKLIRYQRS